MRRFTFLAFIATMTLSGCCWPWYRPVERRDDHRDFHHDHPYDHDHDHDR